MFLTQVRLQDFRCYDELSLTFDDRISVISGLNGQGKTSLLEAIGILTSLKSFRQAKNSEIIRHGCEQGGVSGTFTMDLPATSGETSMLKLTASVELRQKGKVASLNGKKCQRAGQYLTRFAAVSFSPTDLDLVRGPPEERRQWMDRIAALLEPEYADLLLDYQKILQQRNAELRKLSTGFIHRLGDDFQIWTEQLIRKGAEVIHRRMKAVDNFSAPVNGFYEMVAHDAADLLMKYRLYENPSEDFQPRSVAELTEFLQTQFRKMENKERILGLTQFGPQRDELFFQFKGGTLRSDASQGEARSVVLAMRLAEIENIQKSRNIDPILLIDDFSSELDAKRRNFLLNYLLVMRSQVFLSTTEEVPLGKLFRMWNRKDSATNVDKHKHASS